MCAAEASRDRVIDISVKPPLKEFYEAFGTPSLSGYRDAYLQRREQSLDEMLDRPFDDFVGHLRDMGVMAVIRALDAETTAGFKISNEVVASLARNYPAELIGFAGVDPRKGREAVAELRHAVGDLGLRGVNFQLMENRLSANDRRMYPIYEACCELGIPVNLHASFHFVRDVPIDISHPRNLDAVAIDFPDLRIIAAPPGFPWVHELIAVAWRHPNISIGLSAVRPRLLMKPGSGYEPLLAYGKSLLKDRILFGSSYPLVPMAEAIDEVKALPLDRETTHRWLYGNAADVLKIGTASR